MRNQLALVALAYHATTFAIPSISTRKESIVGGEPVNIEDFPFQVDLRSQDRFNCGGSIISDRYVLTAGHCVGDGNQNIRVGNTTNGKGTSYNVTKAIIHPKFDEGFGYDVAVLEISPPIVFGATVKAIPLGNVEPAVGTPAVVSGWGTLAEEPPNYPEVLYAVTVPIYDRVLCGQNYADVTPITADMICAGYPEGKKDSCQGDSGGPMVVDGKVIGLVSLGTGCARANLPGVYTNVADPEIRSFIKDTTGL